MRIDDRLTFFSPWRWTRALMHLYWRFARGMTLGVRAVVLDESQRVFLVRHTYAPGWHLPGGGVEPGETLEQALIRELQEEARLELAAPAVLHGVFLNAHVSRRDHVAVFVVKRFRSLGVPKPNFEIAEAGFFALDTLPDGISPGTLRRIREAIEPEGEKGFLW